MKLVKRLLTNHNKPSFDLFQYRHNKKTLGRHLPSVFLLLSHPSDYHFSILYNRLVRRAPFSICVV